MSATQTSADSAVTAPSSEGPRDPRFAPPEPSPARGGRARPLVRYVVLTVLALLFISPLIFMVVTSFKTPNEAASSSPTWIPNPPTLQAYRNILTSEGTPVLRWFANSMVAATANAVLVVVTAAMAAYPLARMNFRGKRIVFAVIIATLFIPPVILIIPNYLIVGELKWLD